MFSAHKFTGRMGKIIHKHKRIVLRNKSFIRQLNLLLFCVILLLGTSLLSKIQPPSVMPPITDADELHIVDSVKQGDVLSNVSIHVPILMYHYVEHVTDMNDTIRMSLNIPPEIFEQQIVTLQDNEYTFITLHDLTEGISGKKALPDKPVILTFDDGYLDFYTDVFPILQKHQVKAVAYITPGLLDSPNYMDTKHVVEISGSGLVEIGSHTMTHLHLAGSQMEVVYYELHESKRTLEEMTGKNITAFAYPYGAYDQQAVRLVQEAGYTNGVTTDPGVEITSDGMLLMDRIRPGRRIGAELTRYLQQNAFTPY
jgi:peptidoglycan/xylan/chitin deacetylase (PgdA/CDA1 family)